MRTSAHACGCWYSSNPGTKHPDGFDCAACNNSGNVLVDLDVPAHKAAAWAIGILGTGIREVNDELAKGYMADAMLALQKAVRPA